MCVLCNDLGSFNNILYILLMNIITVQVFVSRCNLWELLWDFTIQKEGDRRECTSDWTWTQDIYPYTEIQLCGPESFDSHRLCTGSGCAVICNRLRTHTSRLEYRYWDGSHKSKPQASSKRRETRRLHSSMCDSLQWMVCLQPNRSEEEAEKKVKTGWSETSMLRLQLKEARAVKGPQCWRRKSLELGAHSCPNRTMHVSQYEYSKCQVGIVTVIFLTSEHALQQWFTCSQCFMDTRWPLSTVLSFALDSMDVLKIIILY